MMPRVNGNAALQIVEAIDAALGGDEAVVVATVTSAGAGTSAQPGEKMLVRRDGSTLGEISDPALGSAVLENAGRVFDAFPRITVETL
jgi:xanthine/CO dehydrogenase XdhC/CoxF family maturation factor